MAINRLIQSGLCKKKSSENHIASRTFYRPHSCYILFLKVCGLHHGNPKKMPIWGKSYTVEPTTEGDLTFKSRAEYPHLDKILEM